MNCTACCFRSCLWSWQQSWPHIRCSTAFFYASGDAGCAASRFVFKMGLRREDRGGGTQNFMPSSCLRSLLYKRINLLKFKRKETTQKGWSQSWLRQPLRHHAFLFRSFVHFIVFSFNFPEFFSSIFVPFSKFSPFISIPHGAAAEG